MKKVTSTAQGAQIKFRANGNTVYLIDNKGILASDDHAQVMSDRLGSQIVVSEPDKKSIEDAAAAKFSSSMPAWFVSALPDVRAFVLLPMVFKGHAVGLLYGDWREGTTGNVEKNELLLMRTLRDHLMTLLVPK